MTAPELREWRDFLNASIDQWKNSGAVHPLCPDPDLFVFTTINDALLARDRLEEAVERFIADGRWPQLSSEDTIYMLHRAVWALATVDSLLKNDVRVPPYGKAAFVRMLFVEVWNTGGADYMKDWAEKYLEQNPPPRGPGDP